MPTSTPRTALRAAAVAGTLGLAAAAPASAALPGGNGHVAFVQGDNGFGNARGIELIGFGGGGMPSAIGPACSESDLTPRPCADHPAWAPDGARLAITLGGTFSGVAPTIPSLAVMGADGSGLRVLPTPGLAASRPSWSPDGRALVFEGRRRGRANLYVIRSDGSRLRRLTGAGGGQPSWGSTGRIVFRRKRNLYSVRASGEVLRRLTRRGGAYPDVAPDAHAVVFERRGSLYRLDLRTGRVRLLVGARRRGIAREPAYSPDGRFIVFDSGDRLGGFRSIVRARSDGSGRIVLTTGDEGRVTNVSSPAVQPIVVPGRLLGLSAGPARPGPR